MLFNKKIEKQSTELIISDKVPEKRVVELNDLRQFMLDGYEEIREVKQKNKELEDKIEEYKTAEIIHNATLATLNEFKIRDKENQKEIENLKKIINEKSDRILDLEDLVNEAEYNKKHIEEREKNIGNLMESAAQKAERELKEEICMLITSTKGNLSKSKLVNLIEKVEGK